MCLYIYIYIIGHCLTIHIRSPQRRNMLLMCMSRVRVQFSVETLLSILIKDLVQWIFSEENVRG